MEPWDPPCSAGSRVRQGPPAPVGAPTLSSGAPAPQFLLLQLGRKHQPCLLHRFSAHLCLLDECSPNPTAGKLAWRWGLHHSQHVGAAVKLPPRRRRRRRKVQFLSLSFALSLASLLQTFLPQTAAWQGPPRSPPVPESVLPCSPPAPTSLQANFPL